MNKLSKMTIVRIAVIQIFAVTMLAACVPNTPLTACHATGDEANPYEVINIDSTTIAKEHLEHPDDIYPVPEGGCPTSPLVINNDKITICHATNSETNPYNEIKVSINGLNGHGEHEGDIIPAPEGGCPTSPLDIVDNQIIICHATGNETDPYNEITVNVNGLNGHVSHEDDIIPAPDNGCPTSPLVIVNHKTSICHATGDDQNPYQEINVSVNGLNGHNRHKDDIIPTPKGGCPTSLLVSGNNNDKITICHATGSKTNPYNEITISVSALSGHNNHSGDIIPAPGGGCPSSNTTGKPKK